MYSKVQHTKLPPPFFAIYDAQFKNCRKAT